MANLEYNVVARNGNKVLLMFVPETDADFTVVGATEEEVREAFPDYKPGKLDFYLNKYLIKENGIIRQKGPDGVDITDEPDAGETCFEE